MGMISIKDVLDLEDVMHSSHRTYSLEVYNKQDAEYLAKEHHAMNLRHGCSSKCMFVKELNKWLVIWQKSL